MSLRIRGLTRALGAFALRDVSLDLGPEEYWVLLGPSGCGKSMLLQTVAGLYPLDAGTVETRGRDVTQAPPEDRGIGLVFQKAALFPHLWTAGEIRAVLTVEVAAAEKSRGGGERG